MSMPGMPTMPTSQLVQQQKAQLTHLLRLNKSARDLTNGKIGKYSGLSEALDGYTNTLPVDAPLIDVVVAARLCVDVEVLELNTRHEHLEVERRSMQAALDQLNSPIMVPGRM